LSRVRRDAVGLDSFRGVSYPAMTMRTVRSYYASYYYSTRCGPWRMRVRD